VSIVVAHFLKINYHAATMKITTAKQLYTKALMKRREKILAMRKAGLTWAVIGLNLGITRQRAQAIGGKKHG
jgi:hypothetical protein